jgi:acetolactate synthase small subunit
MIAFALTMVSDRAFNHGQLTVALAEQSDEFRDWAVRSGDEVADSFIGFRS